MQSHTSCMIVTDNDMLMMSGIQHFMFCPRQWALIHIAQAWDENLYTVEGALLHERVDDPFYRNIMGDRRILRKMPLASKRLGLYGFADVVECTRSMECSKYTITLKGSEGYWIPIPIEYKRGKPKHSECDRVQVVAQAMCMEEMYSIQVCHGSVYYAAIRRREDFEITNELRQLTLDLAGRMHDMMCSETIPPAEYSSAKCVKCSLIDICMPKSFGMGAVRKYLQKYLYSDEEIT